MPCLPRFSALHHAALNGNTELISLLLEAQAAVDIKDNKGKCRGPCWGLGAQGDPSELCNWPGHSSGARAVPIRLLPAGP